MNRVPRLIVTVTGALAWLAGAPAPLSAQTNTWEQRTVPVTQSQPKPARRPSNTVKSEPVAPSGMPSAPLPGSGGAPPPSAGGRSLGATTAAPTPASEAGGATDNAAYEAFDQGRYLTALELAKQAASRGDAVAHTLIGRLYAEGFGVPQDAVTAAKWYARGAELGDIESAFALGVLHAQGAGVAKSYTDAARLFEVAAVKGHALANYNLSLLFLKGEGKPLNPHRGFAHMRYAAEQGVVVAQYDLGTLYTAGHGTDPNAFEAAIWIGKAAAQGHVEAQIDYAVILFKDHDVPPAQKAALRKQGFGYLQAAAERGSPVAQNRVAMCYLEGIGVEKDVTEAVKWHLIAKASGVADDSLEAILRKLSRVEREKAQRAADQWLEKAQIQ